MDDEPLPEIAILGAGPVGIEAAMYARFLGYTATVFEQDELCSNVCDWGHVTLFTPFRLNHSRLGLSALQAQHNDYRPMLSEQLHSGQEWADKYLIPLANSDLLKHCFRTKTRVTGISRDGQLPTDHVGSPGRKQTPFRLLCESSDGQQHCHRFDVVIDATGSYNTPNWMGSGGAPAMGEQALRDRWREKKTISDHLFSSGSLHPKQYRESQGNHFVIIGGGYTAATNLMLLSELRKTKPELRCSWLTRHSKTAGLPLKVQADDPLPARRGLVQQVNELVESSSWLQWRPGEIVESVTFGENGFQLGFVGKDETLLCDHLLSNVGYQGDYRMLESLPLHRCYASGGPMNWAASLADTPGDCLGQRSAGTHAVVTSEPDFYVIGSKSYGRDPRFLFATGLEQIRDVFRVVGHRDSLDLYATMGQPAGR